MISCTEVSYIFPLPWQWGQPLPWHSLQGQMVWGISRLNLLYLPAMKMGAISSFTSPKRVSTRATTWGFLNSTGRCIRGRASLPISRLSSDLMGSGFSRPYFSHSAFSLSTISGSTLLPTRKFSDSTSLTASATFSAKRGMRENTSSQRGQRSAADTGPPISSRASRIILPRWSLVIPVPTFPNMRPRHLSHSPSAARARALSRFSAIQSSMVSLRGRIPSPRS